MKDRFFYPLVIAIIAAGIAFALSFGGGAPAPEEQDILRDGFTAEGEDLVRLTAAPGTSFTIAGDASNPAAYAVLSAHLAKDKAPPSAGTFTTLGPQHKKVFSGRPIEIIISARKGRNKPAESFEAGYFAMGAGQSGWQSFELDQDFQEFSFTFTPKLAGDESQNDFVGIWADTTGSNRTLDLEWIKVKVMPETDAR